MADRDGRRMVGRDDLDDRDDRDDRDDQDDRDGPG
jgi:hypothetical protein